MNVAQQLLAYPFVKSLVQFGRERRYYIIVATTCCGLIYVYRRRQRIARTHAHEHTHEHAGAKNETSPAQSNASPAQTHEIDAQTQEGERILERIVNEKKESDIISSLAQDQLPPAEASETNLITPEERERLKKKEKKKKLKQTVIDGVGLVMGESAGKFVESIIDISQTAKKSGVEGFMQTGQLGKIFSKDIIPWLKKKLQNKKFPTIVGTTDSPIGDLHYEVSGITLESLDIDPSLQCDVTDGSEALQIKVLISSAMLKNISWKCGTSKFKEKGSANAEIVKAVLFFRIALDKSQIVPKLSIKHCSIDLQQFNLELKGGKAWLLNKLTTLFSNKIKTKLKEKIDKTLTKKCAMFESKINFAASRVLTLFGDKKKNKTATIEGQQQQQIQQHHKKCFLFSNESHSEEIECVMLDLRSYSDVAELRIAFFGEIGMAQRSTEKVRFRDRSGTLISVSKSTTIHQLIEHADFICFYRDSLSSSYSSSSSSLNSSSTPSLSSSAPPSSLSRPHARSLSSASSASSSSALSSSALSSSSSSSSLNKSWNGMNESQRSFDSWNSYSNFNEDDEEYNENRISEYDY